MSFTIFGREMRRNFKVLLIFCLVLTLYTSMIINMYDPGLGKMLETMQKSMPKVFEMVGMNAVAKTLLDHIVNYLFGFLYKVFPVIFIAFLIHRVVVRYLDRGTIAYLLATPSSRFKIGLTQIIVVVLNIVLLLAYLSALTIALSSFMFEGKLDVDSYLGVIVGLFGLLFFLSSLIYFLGIVPKDSGRGFGIGVSLVILFILMQMISQIGDKFEFVKYGTPLTLFDPLKIAAGNADAINMGYGLMAAGALLYIIGLLVFCKKDLSC